jgi:hypothetical protein
MRLRSQHRGSDDAGRESEDLMTRAAKPAFSWRFEEGELTVRHDGNTIRLGRYATREWAAKAAAAYFAKHVDGVTPAATATKKG